MSFKAIFFDNDGLLVNTEALFFHVTQEVFAGRGVQLTREWYIREALEKGISSTELLRLHNLGDSEIRELRTARHQRYIELLDKNVPLVDGVIETLPKLHGHFVMGVVTSAGKHEFEVIMEKTGLRKFFSFFITADDVKNIKPDPEPYLKAIAHVGFEKGECLVLEDSRRGVQAAKAAGLPCFAIPDELTQGHDFSIADKVLKSIREVPDLVL